MESPVDRVVKKQAGAEDPEEAKYVSAIEEDNEVKTVYAVNSFGSRQLILDFYVPHWLFKIDKSVSRFVQMPAEWKEEGGVVLGFFYLLYYTALIVNCRQRIIQISARLKQPQV